MSYKSNSDSSKSLHTLNINNSNSKSFISGEETAENPNKTIEINRNTLNKNRESDLHKNDDIDCSKPSAEIEDFISKLQLENIGSNEEIANNDEPLILEESSTHFDSQAEVKKKEPS